MSTQMMKNTTPAIHQPLVDATTISDLALQEWSRLIAATSVGRQWTLRAESKSSLLDDFVEGGSSSLRPVAAAS
jgi:hypothetical protein